MIKYKQLSNTDKLTQLNNSVCLHRQANPVGGYGILTSAWSS